MNRKTFLQIGSAEVNRKIKNATTIVLVKAIDMSNIIGKDNFKRMRHSLHLVITALTLFYIGGTSFRKITTMLEILYNIKVSHVI